MPSISLDNHRDPLEQLIEQAAILVHETSHAFHERHRGAAEVAIDLNAEPSPSMSFPQLGLTYKAHFLGSFSGLDNSFLWGWENINNFQPRAVEVAGNARRFGELAHVPEMSTANVPVADEETAGRIASTVARLTGNGNLYRSPTPHGVAYFLIEGFELGASQVVAVERAIINAISTGAIRDHVAALEAYLDMRAGISARGTRTGLVIDCSDGSVEIELDNQQRVAVTRFEINDRTKHGLSGQG